MRPASVDPWSVAITAGSGAVLGILAATAYHVLHDHSRLAFADVVPHFIPQLIAGGVSGALVLGWAAVVHDRKNRRREGTRSPGSHFEHRR